MIKDVVVALLTTTINRYSDLNFDGEMIPKEIIIKDLTGILDYAADLKEESCPFKSVYPKELEESIDVLEKEKEELQKELNIQLRSKDIAVGNVIALENRIREFEETCEANNEVIRQQWEKIVRLEDENKDLKSRFEIKNMEGK